MTPDPITDCDIDAYIDDELDVGRRMEVEDHLARNPEVASRVMADFSARSALRLMFHDGRNASQMTEKAAVTLAQRLARRRWRLPAAGGLAAAAGIAALMIHPVRHGDVPAYVDSAVVSHKVGLLRAAMTSQIETPDFDPRETLKRTRIRMPVLPEKWRITDVQLFPALTGPALQFMIRTDGGAALSMFAVRADGRAATEPVAVRRGDDAVAYWHRDGMAYALTGALRPADMDRVAGDLADNQLF